MVEEMIPSAICGCIKDSNSSRYRDLLDTKS